MELVLGIDLGTSYFKLGLFNRTGEIQGLGRVFVPKDTADDGRCEVPPERFWSVLREGVQDACAQGGVSPEEIRAIAYSSQASTFLLLDSSNKPLTPFVVWLDRRVRDIDPRVRKLWDREDFHDVTGLDITGPEALIAKCCWFQRHHPRIWSETKRIMTITDYFVYGLTGEYKGDEGTAALLGLLELRKHDWWNKGLEAVGISREMLSSPLPLGTTAGHLTSSGADKAGLKAGIPLIVGSLDHNIAAIGAGIDYVAPVIESSGTVLACLSYDSQYSPQPNCLMGAGKNRNQWYQLAFSGNGASVLEWYKDTHAPELSVTELVRMAESVEIGSEGLIAILSADEDQSVQNFENIKPDFHHGHFIRAILEAIAATLSELIDKLCPAKKPEKVVATGGGAQSNLWLQIKSDLLGAEFVATNCTEPACLGAAMLGAIGAGWFANLSEASDAWISIRKRFMPDAEAHKSYATWHKRYLESIGKR